MSRQPISTRQLTENARVESTKTKTEPAKTPAEDYATEQVRDRAKTILGNHQLLMKYAVENNISIPRTRLYFEKVSAGFETEAVIKNWYPA